MSAEQTEMFAPESVAMDSPRLAWMKKHKLITFLSCLTILISDSGWLDLMEDSGNMRTPPTGSAKKQRIMAIPELELEKQKTRQSNHSANFTAFHYGMK